VSDADPASLTAVPAAAGTARYVDWLPLKISTVTPRASARTWLGLALIIAAMLVVGVAV
jgi:hypothetical protein